MVGQLEIISGPMFAGKSTYMLHELSRYKKGPNKNVLIVNSLKNTRNFLTHNENIKINLPNIHIECLTTLLLNEDLYKNSDVIGIDEGQFFTDLVRFCIQAVEKDGKHIIVSGLSHDSDRRKFGYIIDLIPYADKIIYLKALCKCGKNALFSKRIIDSKEQLFIGSEESYISVCREHYLS